MARRSHYDDYSSGDSDADMYGAYDKDSDTDDATGYDTVTSQRDVNAQGDRLIRSKQVDDSHLGRRKSLH